ncbi:MAG: aldolase catalytic domain-containing protein [Planctomycetota bacterium]
MADAPLEVCRPRLGRLTTLDCTLRDGGYHNNWRFSTDFARGYLKAAESAGIDVLEIGFRHLQAQPDSGPFACSHDSFLKQLHFPSDVTVAVMVNLSELISSTESLQQRTDHFFPPRSESPVSMVRVAAHFSTVQQAPAVVNRLHERGYRVGVNLMQAPSKQLSEVENAARIVGVCQPEVLYFADSLGSAYPAQVESIADALRQAWGGEIGFHAHDNRGLALINTLAAAECGVTWLDGTLMGMGRGAGNCRTECLLSELLSTSAEYRPETLYPFLKAHVEPLMQTYGWGPNVLYSLAAEREIHPTYLQEVITHEQRIGSPVDVGRLFEILGTTDRVGKFQPAVLKRLIEACFSPAPGANTARRAA